MGQRRKKKKTKSESVILIRFLDAVSARGTRGYKTTFRRRNVVGPSSENEMALTRFRTDARSGRSRKSYRGEAFGAHRAPYCYCCYGISRVTRRDDDARVLRAVVWTRRTISEAKTRKALIALRASCTRTTGRRGK